MVRGDETEDDNANDDAGGADEVPEAKALFEVEDADERDPEYAKAAPDGVDYRDRKAF